MRKDGNYHNCRLDISKAFHKVYHDTLSKLLIDRRMLLGSSG